MSFFYDLNKKLNGLRAEDKQITESVAKAAAEVKTPARVTLEESLKQDMKALMEGQVNEISKDTKDSYAKKAKTELDIYNRNKNNPAQSAKGKEVAANSAAKREKGLEKVSEGSMKDAMWHDAERMSREQFCAKWGDENCEFWDNISGDLDESKESPIISKLVPYAEKIAMIADKGASAIEQDPTILDNENDAAQTAKALRTVANLFRQDVGQGLAAVVKKLWAEPREMLVGEVKQRLKIDLAKLHNSAFPNADVQFEDGTGGMNFSGSGSLEEKAGYSAKKAAAGKDIGKPGKNFAKIEKSAAKKYGSKEAGARVAGAVLNKLRHANESQLNEYFIEPAGDVTEMLNLNLFDALLGDTALVNHYPEFKQSPEWMAVVKKWKPIALQLANEIRANKGKKMSEEQTDALDATVYDGSDAYDDPRDAVSYFPSTFQEQADLVQEILGNLSESGAGGIHGNFPDPMTQKDQQRKMNPPRSLEEQDQDIMEFLRSKLGHAEPHNYNAGSGKPDAHNGMEFEGNAFTGKLASTPKGGEFELDGEEFKDTSSLEETVSRKHFQQVADLLRNIPDEAKRKEMAMHHASIFKQQNPRFDIARFGAAAGVDLTECGMWEDLKGGQVKLDKNHDGKLSAQDFAMLRGEEEVDEGFADMDAWLAQREKEKGTGRFDSRKVSTGTVYTRKPETFDMDDAETDPEATGGAPKRGRGRPAGTKRATGAKHSGTSKLARKGAIAEEDKESTEKEDTKAEKAGKKVAKDIEHDEGNKAKGDNKAEKAGKKVTKDIEYDDKKDKKEKKVDETTTSGSVATASTSKKSNGMGIGQGIYDSWEREFETLLAESVSVKQESMMGECGDEGGAESITITATGDDVVKLKAALASMGIQHDTPAEEPHSDEACHTCGGVPCQCDELDATDGLPGEMEIEVVEADAPVTQNDPDYPTNQEYSDDALQYSGGLNKPKATGQATTPILASQTDRQVAESNSFYSLVKAILVK